MSWVWLVTTTAGALLSIVVRVAWKRQVGRRLRSRWNRQWLRGRGATERQTRVRRPTPSAYEIWWLTEVDGGDVRLTRESDEGQISAWVPIRRFRNGGIEILEGEGG